MIRGRRLARGEVADLWSIDRSEVIDAVVSLVDGALVRRREHHDVRGWPAGEAEKYTPILEDCHDRGGWLYALFDGDRLVGAAVLAPDFLGSSRDQLQLEFLHVGRDHRHAGLGRRLFQLAASEARRRGAKRLYVSATPSERTVAFYLSVGCTLASEPDPELVAREPDDIHLEYDLGSS